DKKLLAIVHDFTAQRTVQQRLGICDAASGKEIKNLGSTLDIECLTFSPDSRFLATGDLYANLFVWDLSSGKVVINLSDNPTSRRHVPINPLMLLDKQQGPIIDVALSPDGKSLASASADGTVHTWEVETGKFIRSFRGHTGAVTSVAFSPDGHWIASRSLGE